MTKLKAMAAALLLACFAPSVFAWNFTGHVLVAQIAYDGLSIEKQKKADGLAAIIFNQLPEAQQAKLNYQYPSASVFAKVAVLPDVWRKWNLATLFIKFHALPSMDLLTSLQGQTGNWHYIDVPFPQNKGCRPSSEKNVVWAINNLRQNLLTAKLDSTKALEMVFLEHYMGDIHQPLHTATNVTYSCDGDRGGNGFCLKENKHGKCSKNLHSLWDSGAGYLKPHANIKAWASKLEQSYPISQFTNELEIEDVSQWASSNLPNLLFIYSTPPFTKPSPMYYQNGQALAKRQIALAGHRLSKSLNKIL